MMVEKPAKGSQSMEHKEGFRCGGSGSGREKGEAGRHAQRAKGAAGGLRSPPLCRPNEWTAVGFFFGKCPVSCAFIGVLNSTAPTNAQETGHF
jgi:hypothetical protein